MCEDASRRLTYTGDAHVSGPEGDMQAAKIELYLKPSGDELDHVEAYENVTLREPSSRTTDRRPSDVCQRHRAIRSCGAAVVLVRSGRP